MSNLMTGSDTMPNKNEKSGTTVLLLCMFLGTLGIHRFYVGKLGTGILMLLTGGGLGIWYLIDLASIICNRFTDRYDRIIEVTKNPPSFKKLMVIFGILILAFWGFFLSIIITVIIATSVLTEIAQNQLTALQKGDIDAAYAYTSNDFQKATSLENFRGFVQHYHLDSNESASFTNREIKNDIGDIKGTLKLKDGSTLPIEYRLKKEGDQWKIQGLQVGQE